MICREQPHDALDRNCPCAAHSQCHDTSADRRGRPPGAGTFFEFFAAQIRNRNTRVAYLQAVHQFFDWCDEHHLVELRQIRPLHVAAYIEAKQRVLSAPSVKQHLAGLRMLFNWLVLGQVLTINPALFVKGPKFSRHVGITPILEASQMRELLDPIDTSSLKGLRDRAAIALMVYTFARVSAIISLLRENYRLMGETAATAVTRERRQGEARLFAP